MIKGIEFLDGGGDQTIYVPEKFTKYAGIHQVGDSWMPLEAIEHTIQSMK